MKDRALGFLDELGIAYRLVEHPAVFRVEDHAPELAGQPVVKNLLLKDTKTKQVYMVVLFGEKRLDIRKLAEALGVSKSRLTFVRSEEVESVVGVKPGSVSVLNLILEASEGVVVVFDTALHEFSEISFHPNVNTASVFVSPTDAVTIINTTKHRLLEVAL